MSDCRFGVSPVTILILILILYDLVRAGSQPALGRLPAIASGMDIVLQSSCLKNMAKLILLQYFVSFSFSLRLFGWVNFERR